MGKNLIEDLKFSLIMKTDFDILLKNLDVLIRTDIDKNLSIKGYYYKRIIYLIKNLEILPRAE